ncbi:MAG: hypothetical protein HC835_03865 [Oscillatoriales cyanobacterium RM2_1_1]|nr:hypothetical protein [Oscillatoriales cyanobacterium SM2_3_0]NJO44821.1 hypothetical protein [Oscillatoriales cyanobacterium RM2_1_1]
MTNKILAVTRPNRPKMPDASQTTGKLEAPSEDSKTSTASTASASGDEKKKLVSRPQKPTKRSKPQPLVELAEVITPQGEAFKVGERILVRAPWGDQAVAEITNFYQISPDQVVAAFIPQDSKEDWIWEGGYIRIDLLRATASADSSGLS